MYSIDAGSVKFVKLVPERHEILKFLIPNGSLRYERCLQSLKTIEERTSTLQSSGKETFWRDVASKALVPIV